MATITLTADAANAARVVHAFGAYLGLGRDATLQEIHDALVVVVKGIVRNVEQQEQTPAPVTLT